jgi:hypothetical protein
MTAEMFMLYAILGLSTINIKINDHESALMTWFMLSRPDLLTPDGKEAIKQFFPIEFLAQLNSIDKADFFNQFLEARGKYRRSHGAVN